MPASMIRYQRILLKLSGEALAGESGTGFDPAVLKTVVDEIAEVSQLGVKIAIVVGAGNIIRGNSLMARLHQGGLEQVTADQMGMLATIQNGLVLRDLLQAQDLSVSLFSAHGMDTTVAAYSVAAAKKALNAGDVVLCAGGTGNPMFTTDSAACLRGIELDVDVVVKATQVDGVYDSDPKTNPQAKRFERLTFTQMLESQLKVIDLTASALCLEHQMSVIVYRLASNGALARIMKGSQEGTLIAA